MFPTNIKEGTKGKIDYLNRVSKRLNEWISVVDFGAKGDGITDDTAAIRAALSTGIGGRVYFPRGKYLTDPLVVPIYKILEGDGRFVSVLSAKSPGSVIRIHDSNYPGTGHSIIKNLGIVGNEIADYGFEFEETSQNKIEDVAIEGCRRGIYLHNNVWTCHILDTFIRNCGNGIYITALPTTPGQVNHNVFRNCSIMSNRGAGFRLVGGTDIKLLQCDIEKNGTEGYEQYGIYQTGGGQELSVIGCHFEVNGLTDNPTGVNIRIGSDVDIPHYLPIIQGNHFNGGKIPGLPGYTGECKYGIELENTEDALIMGNALWWHTLGGINISGEKNVRTIDLYNRIG